MVTAGDMARFSIEAPRYTSYPTAAEFSPNTTATELRDALDEVGRAGEGPIALYVHLPFCRELCHFCGCHALTARTPERIDRYLEALTGEARAVSAVLGTRRPVGELHFGGGSPSYLEADDFERVMTSLRATFRFTADAAISLEADPRTVDREKLARYRRLGVGRVSFGFQDLDDGVQRAIGRRQSAEVSVRAFETARDVGFAGINLDLCYGLPQQTEATFARTVARVVALGPDRVAVFGYAHVPWMKPLQNLIPTSSLPRADLRIRLMAAARAELLGAGYLAIGLDHFALPADDLGRAAAAGTLHRNFQGYTTTATDALVGLGLSAISDLPRGYFQNARALAGYQAAARAGVLPTERGVLRTAEDVLRGEIIRTLMCRGRLDIAPLEQRFGIRFADAFADELAELRRLEGEGLLRLGDQALELTPLGAAFVRNVAKVFDAYRRAPAPHRFSMTA
ncbi:MAG TPA: oxygen-independent coproporphyrinogen III oxidase [Polyangia bacterium]|nr:oxygen-independent coproporphyrinogen III oxidase [Polyangia bacterium]